MFTSRIFIRFSVFALCLFVFSALAAAQSTGGVKGKVRDPGGSGIAGATVTARQNGKDLKTTRADSKGDFLLAGLESGRYNLVFEAQGYSLGVLYNVEIKKNKTSDLGDRLILTADRGNQIFIKGSVFTKEGVSVPGAKVEIQRVDSNGDTRRLGNTYTDAGGEFTYRVPGAGKLRITATFRGVSSSKDIDVDDPAVYRLAIALDLSPTNK
jgi:hypothetical protein